MRRVKSLNEGLFEAINNEETAYLIFKWINQNLEANFDDVKVNDAAGTYNLGKGSPKGMSSVFNTMCSFLELKTDSVSGYLKWVNEANKKEPVNELFTHALFIHSIIQDDA